MVALGTLSLGGAWAAQWWVACLNNANWLAAHGLLAVVRAFDAVPGGSVAIPDPSSWRWGNAPLAEINVFDLGRARAAHLHARNGAEWLIDTGRPGPYARCVRPALRAFGVTRLGAKGGLLLTRVDADHVSAASLALTELQPRHVVDSLLAGNTLPLRDFPAFPRSRAAGGDARGQGQCDRPRAGGGDARAVSAQRSAAARAGDGGQPRAGVAGTCLDGQGGEWCVLLLPDGADGRAAGWLMANETPEALQSAVLIVDAPVTADFVRAVGARLVVVRSWQEEDDAPVRIIALPTLPGVTYLVQQDSGAVNLRIYPDKVEARGFVDGLKTVIPK